MANNSSATTATIARITENEKIFSTVGLIALSIVTLFGNTLVVVAFYTYRPLRTHTNYFIVSLSMSDILVALVSMPVWITFIMMDMDFKLLDGKLVHAWTCVDIMTGLASILNLTAVSVDRYIHVIKPMTHSKLITRPRVLYTILLIWIFSLSLSLLKGLMFDFWNKNRPIYETLVVSIGFIIPFFIIMYCYLRIYQVVKNQLLKFMEQTKCLQSDNREKTDVKAIKTIAIVILAFFICWGPFFVLNLFHGWCIYYKSLKECKINVHLIRMAKWLHYTNSSLNPIIYACFNREFRNGFKIALYKHLSSRNSNNATFNSIIKRTSIRSAIYEPSNSPAVFLGKPRSRTFDGYGIKRDSIVSTTNIHNGRSKVMTRFSTSPKSLAIPSSL